MLEAPTIPQAARETEVLRESAVPLVQTPQSEVLSKLCRVAAFPDHWSHLKDEEQSL